MWTTKREGTKMTTLDIAQIIFLVIIVAIAMIYMLKVIIDDTK